MNRENYHVTGRITFALATVLALCAAFLVALVAPAPARAATITATELPGTTGLTGMACASAHDCVAVGADANGGVVAVFTDGQPSSPVEVPGTSDLNAVACPTATTCEAVGTDTSDTGQGVVVTITNGSPGPIQTVPGTTFLNDVACASTTSCVAVGKDSTYGPGGAVVTITNGTAGAVQDVPDVEALDGVACATATSCEAAGGIVYPSTLQAGALVPITDGTVGTVQARSGLIQLDGVACPTSTVCYVVGTGGAVLTVDNGTVTATRGTGQSLSGIGCATATTCVAVGTAENSETGLAVQVTDGVPVLTQAVSGAAFLYGATCPGTVSCTVVGTSAAVGDGVYASVPITAVSLPSAPTGVGAERGSGAGTASIGFGAPTDDGGLPVTGYTVTATDTTNAANGGQTATGTASPISMTGLTDGDTYTFTVTATNALGSGAPSAASNPVIPATVPGAPTDVQAVAGNASAIVSFVPPADDGGLPIGGYQVSATDITTPDNGGQLAHGSTSPITITDLTNGDTYTFTVLAGNTAGEGAESAPSNEATPLAVPGAPGGATATAGNASASVSFVPPADDGGSPVTSYLVTAADQTTPGNGGQAGIGTGSPIGVFGLTNGDTYTFTVTATNAVGNSTPSAPSNPVVPATLPGAPTGVAATPANASAVVSFTAPSSDGGSSITSYTASSIDQTTGTDGPSVSGAAPPLTVGGLINGDSYTFTVTATNGVGTSVASTPSAAVTPAAVPSAPTDVSAVAGNESAVVSFTPPASDGGSAITGYEVTATDSTNPANSVQAAATGSPAEVAALTNGDSYTFTVVASNAMGNSTASAPSAPVVPAGVATTTTLSSSRNPSVVGNQVTLTAALSPAAASGVVRFTGAAGTPLSGCGLVSVRDGTATCDYTFTAAGSYPITAAYFGDDTYSGSSGGLTQQVHGAGVPTTTISVNPPGLSAGPVTVSITATDTDSQATITTRCVLDPGTVPASFADLPSVPCPYLGAGAVVDTDGPHTIYAASTDSDGNTEATVQVASFTIDDIAPVSTGTPGHGPVRRGTPLVHVHGRATVRNASGVVVGEIGPVDCWNGDGIVLTLNATDQGSGVAGLTYAASGAQPIAETTTSVLPVRLLISKAGWTTVTFYATDKAGNVESPPHSEAVFVASSSLGCAAATPTGLHLPASGSITITGTITIGRWSWPFEITIEYGRQPSRVAAEGAITPLRARRL